MCGIAGQVRPDGGVERALIDRMCAAQEHRGPDSRGIHCDGRAGLGIQRLAVIDLATGDQPIYSEDGSVVVVLNGEIYNHAELRDELRARGHVFATRGDTEVIVHAYESFGDACVNRLHGMFAFALWDTRRRRLLIARDRVGKKPLHYALRPGGALSFASELGSLLQDEAIPRGIDRAAIDRYLAYGYVPAPQTAFAAVRKLPPAHTLVWEQGRVTLERYWRLDHGAALDTADAGELGARVWDAIRAATRRRLVADVPLGAFLSGGIDSSAVVAAMAHESSGTVKTFSIGFDRPGFDELPYARMIADRFGTEHHEFVVEPASVDLLPRIARHHGEPFADASAVPSFMLSALAREHVTVALNGDGGDESFAGYQRYVANSVAARLDRLPAPLRRALVAAGARLPDGGAVTSPRNRARRLARSLADDEATRYARYVAVWDEAGRHRLWRPEARPESDAGAVIAAAFAGATGEHVLDRLLAADVATYLPGDLLTKIDIATMAHGLEGRSPLLDHELMELAAALPADLKVRGTEKKWILREALRGTVPDAILDRPKQGFSVPLGAWFRDELRGWVREVLLDDSTTARGWFDRREVEAVLDRHAAGVDADEHRLWSLVMLELWQRECVDRVPLAAVGA